MTGSSTAGVGPAPAPVPSRPGMMGGTRSRHAAGLMGDNPVVTGLAPPRRRPRRRREPSPARDIPSTPSSELSSRPRSLQSPPLGGIEEDDSLFLPPGDEFRPGPAEDLDADLGVQDLNGNDEDFGLDQGLGSDDNASASDDLEEDNATRHSPPPLSRIGPKRRRRDQAIEGYADVFPGVAVSYSVNRVYDVTRTIMSDDGASQIRSRPNQMSYRFSEGGKRRRLGEF